MTLNMEFNTRLCCGRESDVVRVVQSGCGGIYGWRWRGSAGREQAHAKGPILLNVGLWIGLYKICVHSKAFLH